ncbi:siderophore-interacting protein [Nocardiopsis suaedae]|uniref:Siderophore-interacting protein n=1 Tax=Nocardiopsis suaedae TaxID=3018444 RepID=A0ABT4TLC5_9ACTN|nr:siderophore-interacting protein [Nocardiopsis suaedae]MDA2805190.1 siderophore-interacting protein [Nocardiopsis suaedae]
MPVQARTETSDVTAVAARAVGTCRVADHMVRVTLAHPSFADPVRFPYHGPDHLVRLLLPGATGALNLPRSSAGWWKEIQAMDEPDRPRVRNYTVRRIDRARAEIDVDFVLHTDSAGPASAWAAAARPGDGIGVLSDRAGYAPPAGATDLLLVADETAQPALAAIIESLPADARALAILEYRPGSAPGLPAHPGVERVHLHPADGAEPGEAALAHVEGRDLGPLDYAWISGESTLATSLRRHLVSGRGMDKDRVFFCGYWKRGVSH